MKKLLCTILVFIMTTTLCAPIAAVETESTFVPETFTREELLAMDPELDSDGDGLVDVIELVYEMNRYHPDTDGDGVSDYTEFCVTCTDPLTPDGHLDTDGDGLTNAQEAIYRTNPDDLDTDNDNLGDYDEIMFYHTDPLVKDNNTLSSRARPNIEQVGGGVGTITYQYSGTLHTPKTRNQYGIVTDYYESDVSYNLNFNWFFANNTDYNQDLAITSSLLAAIAYKDNYLDNVGATEDYADYAVYQWYQYHGFYCIDGWDMHSPGIIGYYNDQHLTQSFVAVKPITYNGVTKYLVSLVIRGTNETLEEWRSNFDVGATNTPHEHWKNSTNHMGFDIAANRIDYVLDYYMNEYGLNSSNSILWITGHSRGAAVANIIAANKIDAGYDVFAYTFACPGTTERTSDAARDYVRNNYASIFNIINEDDLVPQLPLSDWGFVRYGIDKTASVEESYASQWDALVGGNTNYQSNKEKTEKVIEALSDITANRTIFYRFRDDETGYIEGSPVVYDAALAGAKSITDDYPSNTISRWEVRCVEDESSDYYIFRIYQQPAFLMQLLAALKGGEISEVEFVLTVVVEYMRNAKSRLVLNSNKMEYPHYPESYYLLALNIEN